MTLADDLTNEVGRIFREQWTIRDGRVVPDPIQVGLSNDAVHLSLATILYADLSGSTSLVDNNGWSFAAEIYRAYLYCAARIIRSESGSIVSYDGDRIMAVFLGDDQGPQAVRTAMKVNNAVAHIINPGIQKIYPNNPYLVSRL